MYFYLAKIFQILFISLLILQRIYDYINIMIYFFETHVNLTEVTTKPALKSVYEYAQKGEVLQQ